MSHGARHKRVFRELAGFTNKTDATIPEDWQISLVNEDNIFEWKATFAGPDNTAYKYGIFEVNIKFGTQYPFKPPTVLFRSKMFHPNISSNGGICLTTLSSGLEIEPRVGPSKVGVQKYHAWECTLAIFEVLSGCFWLWEPPQVPRGKCVFLGSSGKF